MRLRWLRLVPVLLVLLQMTGWLVPAAAQRDSNLLDLADVPVPVQALPEVGYQVLSGDVLDRPAVVAEIAAERTMDVRQVEDALAGVDLVGMYTLTLALPEDRADPNAAIVAAVQTNVHNVGSESQAETLQDVLGRWDKSRYVEPVDLDIENSRSWAIVAQSGETLRTVVRDGTIVLEVISLDTTGQVAVEPHVAVTRMTVERLDGLRQRPGAGLATRATQLAPRSAFDPYVRHQQSGTHLLYRFRDGGAQLALGELEGPLTDDLPSGLSELLTTSRTTNLGSGRGYLSLWLAEFENDASARTFMSNVEGGEAGSLLADPFFIMSTEESWTTQGISGLYRVSGNFRGDRYSGTVEVRQEGRYVAAVAVRTSGLVAPSAALANGYMDHQLACLGAVGACDPLDISGVMTAGAATPGTSGFYVSPEYGWVLKSVGPDWKMTSSFAEQGYDGIELQNGVSQVSLESVVNHHGDPVQCVLDEMNVLRDFEEHADIRLWDDVQGESAAGNESGHAWAIYTVEPLTDERADQEYTIRIDCYALVAGEANLVMTQRAPRDLWMQERSRGEEIRHALYLPRTAEPRDTIVVSAHERRVFDMRKHWIDRAA